ncbi:hypothetical protein GCM10010365_00400 [Streptomyces poonensis]|uniref:Uncharacterized protein n=1 Tax=Streptomyces poonensis TaxID=68255 RepID=A0A918P782_9ACTN|nr:hypothetical protein GCM10010365_00400 [Streptomyces poonensis]GLJ92244.1 hypothetical protein GCM10017589_48530 [Streptomyces poonensis]
MLQAMALPATPSSSAAEAEATPRYRTGRAMRGDMDTIALHGKSGGLDGNTADCGSGVLMWLTGL